MTDRSLSVENKRVIITGGSHGLGWAVAKAFAAQGAHVAVIDTDTTVAGSGADGIAVFHGDVADPRLGRIIEEAIAHLGGVDVVFANAGIAGRWVHDDPDIGLIENQDWPAWKKVHDINLDGVVRVIAAVVPTLKAQRSGRIIVTSSIAGLRGNVVNALEYQTSKAAVLAVVRGTALQLAPFGVTVNAIAPGPIRTGIGDGLFDDVAFADALQAAVPLGRIADPEEIVGAVQLFASDASGFITGTVLPIDGGITIG